MRNNFFALIFVVNLVFSAVPLAAQETDPADDAEIFESDEVIETRITAIFSEIDTLSDVNVAVEAGVVTLSGLASNAEAISRAAEIAAEVDGVVTVENKLERDVSLDSRLAPAVETSASFIEDTIKIAPLLVVAIIAFILISLAGRFISSRAFIKRRLAPNAFVGELIATTIRIISIIFAAVVALSLLDLTAVLGAFLGAAGVIGLAISFAVRDTIENYLASIMLSVRQPFKPNDHVVIDGNEGRVIRLSSRATILLTMDGNHLRIPNAQVFKAIILNYTRNPERRFEFSLGVDANDDPLEAIEAGLAICRESNYLLSDPEAIGYIREVGDSNIVIVFLAWVDQRTTSFVKARSATIAAVKDRLEDDGFALPEPIYRLRFDDGFEKSAPSPKSVDKSSVKEPRRRKVSSVDVIPESDVTKAVEEARAKSASKDLLNENAVEE